MGLNRGQIGVTQPGVRPDIISRRFRTPRDHVAARHWVRGDPYATAFFNALSAVFPHGEAFMIRTMAAWVDRLPEDLRDEARSFIEQEAGHTREHAVMNRGLGEAGYQVEPLQGAIKAFVGFFEGAGDVTKIAATACIEHLTAIVAAELIENAHHLDGTDDQLRELWIWHALEEIEHKSVAFDVWVHATRSWSGLRRYLFRSSLMLAISASFFFNRTMGQVKLLKQDGIGFWSALMGVMRCGFGEGGIARAVARPWAKFLRPGFHPWDVDDRLLLAKGEAMLATAAAKRAGYDGAPIAPVVTERRVPADRQAA